MRFSRTLLGAPGVLICGSAIGHQAATAAVGSPSVSIRRITSLAGRVVTGDFNGDGIVDLASASSGATFPRPAAVSLGKGDGTFGASIVSAANGGVLAPGDFDKDGKLDLIASLDTGDMPLNFMRGNGDGTFAPPQPIGGAVVVDLTFATVADFDGDGNLDIAVGMLGESGADRVLVCAGHGDGTFTDVVTTLQTGTFSFPHGAAAADVNGDGRPDLVVANHDAHTASVFLNKGAFNFLASHIPLDRQANDVAIADVNRDGKPDLLVATSHEGSDDLFYIDGFVYVLRGSGDGTFGAPAQYATEPGAWQIAIGDFNRDGVPDVATVNKSAKQDVDFCGFLWDSVSILPGSTDGAFGAASSFSLGNQSNLTDFHYRGTAASIAAVDVNGDGWKDLAASAGAILINQAPDPNWPPTVTALAPQPDANHSIALSAAADDVDQDRLSYRWTESGGQPIEPTATPCRFTPATGGAHTFTVTVDDHHGHTASSSVTVDFGSISGGGGGGTSGPTMTLAAPAAGETIESGSPYAIRFHVDDPSMALYEWSIDYSLDNGATFNHIWECHDAGQSSRPGVPTSRDESCTWMNPGPASTQAILLLYAQDDADAPIGARSTVRFAIAPQAGGVPYPWQHRDIGAVAKAGTTTFSNGVFSVTGSGADIWGAANELQYAYLAQAPGSLTILEAHVDSVLSPSKGVAMQYRAVAGGTSASAGALPGAAPGWLKLQRRGSTFTSFWSTDGVHFTQIGSVSVLMNTGISVGLAVTSHNASTPATATFDSVTIQQP